MLYFDPTISSAVTSNGATDAAKAQQQRAALRKLEGEFVKMLFSEMRKSVPKGGLFPDDFATQTQQEMLDEALASSAASSGQFGIAAAIEAQIKAQEASRKLHMGASDAATQLTQAARLSSGADLPITATAKTP